MSLQKSSGVMIANAAAFLIIQYGDYHPDQLLMLFQHPTASTESLLLSGRAQSQQQIEKMFLLISFNLAPGSIFKILGASATLYSWLAHRCAFSRRNLVMSVIVGGDGCTVS